MKTEERAKVALFKKFKELSDVPFDSDGYLEKPDMNLLSGVIPELIEKDYLQGNGREWDNKIRAIHSSAALAANTFGRWMMDPSKLKIKDLSKFCRLKLEAHCPTGLQGTPPHLDVVLESSTDIVGVESKFLESLTPKKPEFSDSYSLAKLPYCEKQWWTLLNDAKLWSPSYFDVAQIVKHYLGLRNTYKNDNRRKHLFYIYWQPSNAADFSEYRTHQKEINKAANFLRDSQVNFVSISYDQLWSDWKSDSTLREHALNLIKRYWVEI